MKFSFAILSLFATLAISGPIVKRQNTNSCAKINIRQNIAELTPAQVDAFFKAVQALKNTPDPVVPNISIYDKYVKIHIDFTLEGHGTAQHAPWHRFFLYNFEQDLQKVDPSVVLPYWDWSVSSQSPERSIVFTDSYVGGNGDARTGCVTTGRFANWQIRFPQPGCLQRRFDGGNVIGAFTAPELLNKMVYESTSFEEFATTLEYGIHARVHNGIGGSMANMWSNSDPVFYIHHANTDRMWSMYQSRGQSQANEYNGKRPDGSAGNLDDVLQPFGKTVREAMDMVNNFCYTYTTQDIPRPVTKPANVTTTLTPTRNDTTTPTPWTPQRQPWNPRGSLQRRQSSETDDVTESYTPSPETDDVTEYSTPSPEADETDETDDVTETPETYDVTESSTSETNDVTESSTPSPEVPTSTPRNTFVSAYDRTNMNQIRLPVKVPTSWLVMHNMSPTMYDEIYDTLSNDVQDYNTRYVDSVASLQYYTDLPTDKLPAAVFQARGLPVPNPDNLVLTLPIGKVRVLSAKGMTVTDESGTVPASSVDPNNLPVAKMNAQSSAAARSSAPNSLVQLAVAMVAALVYLA